MTARLPKPGGDDNTWGDILNDFLDQSHNSDGTLNPNIVGTNQLQNNAVTNAKLDSAVQTSLTKADNAPTTLAADSDVNVAGVSNNQVLTFSSGSSKWIPGTASSTIVSDATTSSKGIVQLAGDLGGTATTPTVPGALKSANNLSDLNSASSARTNLSLGGAATLNVGTTGGTVAAGNDARFAGSAAGTAGAALSATDASTTNSRAPTGSASGDLTGSYPSPTIKSSVGLSGNPTATTQTAGDSSTKIATTAYVDSGLSGKQTSLGYTAENVANKGVASGYASLDGSALLPTTQLPSSVVNEHVVALGNRSTDYALSLTGFLDTLLTVTLTGSWTLSFSGSIAPGTTVTLEFTQDGAGNRIVTLPTLNVTYPFGAFVLNSAASSASVITFYTSDGTNWRAFKAGTELSLGYSATTAAAGNDPRLLTANPPPKAHGLLGWTFHPQLYSAAVGFSSNNLIIMKLWMPSPLTITNIVTYYQTAGTVPTSGQCFAALYDSSGTRVAVSADLSAVAAGAGLITSTGLQTIPLGSPYSWAGGQDAYLYVAFLVNASTTPKLMIRAMNGDSVWANIACSAGAPQCAISSGQTSAATSLSLSSLALSNTYPWLALS